MVEIQVHHELLQTGKIKIVICPNCKNRENLEYTKETKQLILNRIKEVSTHFISLYNEQVINLKDEEEIIVDITHSFRSLPMLLITLLNFAKQVKRIKVTGIYYAAFESLGTMSEIAKIQPEDRIVPILNLTSFSQLQDWTNATYDFINYGNVKRFRTLINASKDLNNNYNVIEKFFPTRVVDKLNELVENIALCRGKELLSFNYDELKSNIIALKEIKIPKPFYYLIENR